MQLRGRIAKPSQRIPQQIVSQVLIDGARDRERDDDGADLCDVDERDRGRDVLRGGHPDLGGGDGVCGLGGGAAAHGDEDGVAVDGGRGRRSRDGRHERTADESEYAREDEPGHVVSELGHGSAVEQDEKNEEEDEGQETDGGLQRGVAARELEVDRDVVYWDEDGSAATGGEDVEKDHAAGVKEECREDAVGFGGERGPGLGEDEGDEGHAEEDEADDGLVAVPEPGGAAEGEGQEKRGVGGGVEEDAEPVEGFELLQAGDVGLGLEALNEEEVDWAKEGADDEINVEGLS